MQDVLSYLESIPIKDNDTVVIACSGGPDSMALMDLTIKYREKHPINIVCAHVNHNVREVSKDEKIFVENYCKDNNVTFEFMVINNYGDDNFHNEARTKRYNYFEEIVNKYNAKFLFTAHHGDDLMETILMRINRGTNLRGYAGFKQIVDMNTYKIVRPLVTLTKQEILDYNTQNNISFVTDESNKKDVYTRNRYRKYIVSELKKEEQHTHLKFLKFSKTIEEVSNYIDKIVKLKKEEIYPNNEINIDKFIQEEHIIQTNIIYNILETIYQDDLMLITDKHVELIINLINSDHPNSVIHLPNNLIVTKTYNKVTFDQKQEEQNEYEIELIKSVILDNGKTIEIIDDTEDNSNYICRLNSEEITLPIYVRNKKDGDKMTILGLEGSKKIKDIFINEKVPVNERNNYPVLVDAKDNILWLPGLKKSNFNKTKKEKYDIIIKYY